VRGEEGGRECGGGDEEGREWMCVRGRMGRGGGGTGALGDIGGAERGKGGGGLVGEAKEEVVGVEGEGGVSVE